MNIACISCQGRISSTFSWKALLSFSIFTQGPLVSLDQWLCKECHNHMSRLVGEGCSEGCTLCSRSLVELNEAYIREVDGNKICYDCQRWIEWEERMKIDRVITQNKSAITYNQWAQEIIKAYKFNRDERLKYFFSSLLIETWYEVIKSSNNYRKESIDIVTAIPLSQERLEERGFNQSGLIAQLLAQKLNLPFEERLLLRRNDESKQSKKGREERLEEMLKKFLKNSECVVDIHNMSILLIDDIYTTGATMYAAAYALRRAGAKEVVCLTIAR